MSEEEIRIITDGNGQKRKVGLIRPKRARVAALPKSTLTIPESDYTTFLDKTPLKMRDQGPIGSCNGHAAIEGVEFGRWVAGAPHIDLSPHFVYANLCQGIDQGSSILDALDFLANTGTCPDDMVPFGTINPALLTSQARSNASRFRIEIGRRVVGWDAIMSAVQLHKPLNFALRASGNYSTGQLDADGVIGYSRGPADHAVFVGGGAKWTKRWGWVALSRGSWGTQFADQGCYYICEKHSEATYFECYELVAIIDDPLDTTVPPKGQ